MSSAAVRSEDRRLVPLFEGHRRQRVLSDLPLRLRRRSVTLLTDGKSRNTGAKWSHDAQWIAYGSTRRTGNDVDIYVVGARDPKSDRRVLELSGGGWQVADWSPDDRKLLVVEGISLNETYLWLADVATGQKTLLTPKTKEKVAYKNAAFSRDGRGLYLTTDAGSEFQRLAYMDLASKKAELLTPDTADVDDIDLSEDGTKLVYVTNEKGVSVIHLLDTATRRELPGPKLPIGEVAGTSWHKDGGAIAFTMGGARSTDDAWSWTWKTGKLERWTTSELGGLNPETFPRPSSCPGRASTVGRSRASSTSRTRRSSRASGPW